VPSRERAADLLLKLERGDETGEAIPPRVDGRRRRRLGAGKPRDESVDRLEVRDLTLLHAEKLGLQIVDIRETLHRAVIHVPEGARDLARRDRRVLQLPKVPAQIDL